LDAGARLEAGQWSGAEARLQVLGQVERLQRAARVEPDGARRGDHLVGRGRAGAQRQVGELALGHLARALLLVTSAVAAGGVALLDLPGRPLRPALGDLQVLAERAPEPFHERRRARLAARRAEAAVAPEL